MTRQLRLRPSIPIMTRPSIQTSDTSSAAWYNAEVDHREQEHIEHVQRCQDATLQPQPLESWSKSSTRLERPTSNGSIPANWRVASATPGCACWVSCTPKDRRS